MAQNRIPANPYVPPPPRMTIVVEDSGQYNFRFGISLGTAFPHQFK